jgi:hypothetical protein
MVVRPNDQKIKKKDWLNFGDMLVNDVSLLHCSMVE